MRGQVVCWPLIHRQTEVMDDAIPQASARRQSRLVHGKACCLSRLHAGQSEKRGIFMTVHLARLPLEATRI